MRKSKGEIIGNLLFIARIRLEDSENASIHYSAKTGSFLGQVEQTQFGPVQVKVTLSRGRITKVATTIYPTGTFRGKEINSQAIPMLEQ